METSPMFQSSPASPKQLWGGSYFSTSTCSLLAAGDCLNSCTKLVSFVQVPKISFRGNLSTFIKICPFILQQWPLWRVSLYFPVSASFPLSNFLFSLKWGGCLIFSCNGNYSMELDHVHALQRQRRLWKNACPKLEFCENWLGVWCLLVVAPFICATALPANRPDPKKIPN